MSLATATTTTVCHSPCVIGSTLSNTHYLPSGYLSHDRNITSSSGTMTVSWTTELLSEFKAGQQVGRLHADLDSLLFHTGVMDTLQHPLHVPLQLGPFRHQLPPMVYLCNSGLILETTHQCIRLCVVRIVGLEHEEVGGVVVGSMLR